MMCCCRGPSPRWWTGSGMSTALPAQFRKWTSREPQIGSCCSVDSPAEAILRYPWRGSSYHQPGVWLRRQEFLDCGGLDCGLHFAFDREMMIRFLAAGAVVRTSDRPLAGFRLHAGSKTVAQSGRFDEEQRQTLNRFAHHGPRSLQRLATSHLERMDWWSKLERNSGGGCGRRSAESSNPYSQRGCGPAPQPLGSGFVTGAGTRTLRKSLSSSLKPCRLEAGGLEAERRRTPEWVWSADRRSPNAAPRQETPPRSKRCWAVRYEIAAGEGPEVVDRAHGRNGHGQISRNREGSCSSSAQIRKAARRGATFSATDRIRST